jgi:two-component system, response regulator RegA
MSRPSRFNTRTTPGEAAAADAFSWGGKTLSQQYDRRCMPSPPDPASGSHPRTALPLRLLLVDDETPILFAMANYFRAKGYVVDAAREREEAEALLTNVAYAAVIVDLRMTAVHGADGLEVVVYARERCPAARIIVLTAYGSPAAEAEARARGADAFLHKPQPLADLAQLLDRLLGKPEP